MLAFQSSDCVCRLEMSTGAGDFVYSRLNYTFVSQCFDRFWAVT